MRTYPWRGTIKAGAIERIAGIGFLPDSYIVTAHPKGKKRVIRHGKWSETYVSFQNPNTTEITVGILFLERDNSVG